MLHPCLRGISQVFRSGSAQGGASSARLANVQWLRALAAVLVVTGHAQTIVAGLAATQGRTFSRWTGPPWGAGVDLFFVISGFIMVYASRDLFARPQAGLSFLARRLARIAPLYWIATSLYLLILLAAHLKGDPHWVSQPAIVAAYLFLPFDTYGAPATPMPVMDLGWTLNYEMFFYALFALAVGLRMARAAPLVLLMILGLVAAGAGLQPSHAAPWFWTRPIMLDFGLGVLLGWARCSGLRLGAAWGALAAMVGLALFLSDPLRTFDVPAGVTVANGWPRVIDAGAPAALLLAGLTLGRPAGAAVSALGARLSGVGVRLGDASYALYLFHPFVLFAMERVVRRTDLARAIGLRVHRRVAGHLRPDRAAGDAAVAAGPARPGHGAAPTRRPDTRPGAVNPPTQPARSELNIAPC